MFKLFNIFGFLLKKTYKFEDDSYSNIKYIYFFFYQRVLLFNFFIPWPVHFTSYITSYKKISFGKKTSPGSGPNQYIQAENGIIIGDNVQFAPGVQLISSNHDFDNFDRQIKADPIVIGSNVWIGGNVIVLPSVVIGDNVIIGAGSVVTKNIPSDSIAVGNPCRVIKQKKEYEISHDETLRKHR
jgi:acetyltransferase-like isoleucine patch superfamily enzyme